MRTRKKIEITRQPLFLISNIAYTQVPHWFGLTNRCLYLNIIRPQKLPEKPLPTIVWFCGGAWEMMDTGAHIAELTWFAEHGYVIASVQYRSSIETIFPGQLQDAKAAIRYLRAHASQFGIDKNRIAVMGESAGAHLACLVGVTGDDKMNDVGDFLEESSAVQAVVDWYGISDLRVNELHTQEVVPPEIVLAGSTDRQGESFGRLSPITYIDDKKTLPPFLILHGNQDKVVSFAQSERLYEALQKVGVRSELIEIEGADHADIHFSQTETKEYILNFLDDVLLS